MRLKSNSADLIYKALQKREVSVKIISKKHSLLEVEIDGKSTFIRGTSFPVNSQPACFIANNKYLTKRILRSRGIPTPKSWLLSTKESIRKKVAQKNLFPFVLKPVRGAHGNRVYANIESFEELEEILPYVFEKYKKRSVLLEEFIKGNDYRFIVVGNKVSAVMQRIPAYVTGDGKKNIRQLIRAYNKNPLVGKKYEKPLCRIILNGEVIRNLKKQKKEFTYIPKDGETISLRQNANISTGGVGKDVTGLVGNNVKELAISAAKAIGIAITGVDIIIENSTQKPYVLELNDTPGIDIHHYPYIGNSQNVASDIVDYLSQNMNNKILEDSSLSVNYKSGINEDIQKHTFILKENN